MNYFIDKEKRAEKAQEHTKNVAIEYKEEIKKCAKETKTYTQNHVFKTDKRNNETEIIINDSDSVSAIYKFSEGKTCVLNFASYKNPGGRFFDGSSAQEESLCHESFLYNVLKEQNEYYEWNNENRNRALYKNRALYSENVIFKRTKEINCDVLTCAAPNFYAAKKYLNVTQKDNSVALKERTEFVLDVASEKEVDTLILGAWGCGVFGQNPKEVAEDFKALLDTKYKNKFKKIVFAIIDENSENYKAFKEVFGVQEIERDVER